MRQQWKDVSKSCSALFRRKCTKTEMGEKSSCEDQENTAIMPKFWDVTLAGGDSRNIQTHKVILVTINHVK